MLAGLKNSLNLRVSFGCLKDSLVSLSALVMDIINPMLSNPVMLNSFSKPATKSPKTTSEMRNSRCHSIHRQVGIPLFHKCQIKTEKPKKQEVRKQIVTRSKMHSLVQQHYRDAFAWWYGLLFRLWSVVFISCHLFISALGLRSTCIVSNVGARFSQGSM